MLTEADTCRTYIVPKLHAAGWEDDAIAEQRVIAPGRIVPTGQGHIRQNKRRPDYILFLRKDYPIAVVEAKAEYRQPGDGLQQAMNYAQMLGLKFAYASNGHGIVEHNFITGSERALTEFPRPDELWRQLRGKLELTDDRAASDALTAYFEEVGSKTPRYYQIVAVNRAVEAVIRGQPRILLTMATGTGKTFVAFQIVYRLWKTKRKAKILYLADRNVLIDQAKDRTFSPLGEPLHKIQGEAVRGREIYFALYQALIGTGDGPPLYEQYPHDFFDLIIVDECHRGSARDESNWHLILEYFNTAQQIGMTATPKLSDNVDTYAYFGDPIYTYSLRQGIEDGFLAPYRVQRVILNVDAYGVQIDPGVVDRFGRDVPSGLYGTKDFERLISLLTRTEAVAAHLSNYLRATNRFDKTIVFCVDQAHALAMRQALINANADLVRQYSGYVARVVSDEGVEGRMALDDFQDPEVETPVIVTTSQMLTTGVDAPTVRNIVLFKPIGSMTDFKQIIGRGTRVLEEHGKYWFTIIDYTGATRLFYDSAFDGDPVRVTRQTVDAQTGEVIETYVEAGDTPAPGNATEYPEPRPPDIGPHEPRVPRLYVDGVPVYILADQAYELDPEGHVLRTVAVTDYVGEHVRRLCPTSDHLRQIWPIAEQRAEIVQTLNQHGIDLEHLAQMTHHLDADAFDLLLHVAYNAPLVSRRERAEKLRQSKPNFFNTYTPAAREILDALLDKYADYGLNELTALHYTLQMAPFDRHGDVPQIVGLFGGADQLKAAVDKLQVMLYEA